MSPPDIGPRLFAGPAPNAERQARTDRLLLRREVDRQLPRVINDIGEEELRKAHAVLVRWADLESTGRLAAMQETQFQGDILSEIFGSALGFVRWNDGAKEWELSQHQAVGGVTPDGVIGEMGDHTCRPVAVIELKGSRVHLDRDRSNGRTAIQQCWDYLDAIPEARWGIVSNIVSFRLYERSQTPRRYEHFALQDLRDFENFVRFYTIFSRRGLLRGFAGQKPYAAALLERTNTRQKEVGDELYESYRRNREDLIRYLNSDRGMALKEAAQAAQTLLDRVLFIAFCEDRDLVPDNALRTAYERLPAFARATNPRWRNFVELFRSIDEGNDREGIPAYNGGLFRPSLVDELDLPDEPWTRFFDKLSRYDFADEVNLDVLGHLFEKSITELEKLLEGDFFGSESVADQFVRMPKSAIRKRYGVYYTPPEFTAKITELAVDRLIAERFAAVARAQGLDPETANTPGYWRGCLEVLLRFRVVDPACGSGAFLFQAYETLESRYGETLNALVASGDREAEGMIGRIPELILERNLYGVDLSEEAVEITRLALWIKSARRGKPLSDLSHNIRHGNSLVSDRAVDPHAFDWRGSFPEVFAGDSGGFDAVIGNPPWERIKLQEREFFALSAPEIATAANAAGRARLIKRLGDSKPELHEAYVAAQERAARQLDYCRKSGAYPLTGKGDINLYAVFAELASKIVSPSGRVGMLMPSGIATDATTKDFFQSLTDAGRLRAFHDFENKRPYFPDVHRAFKFCILNWDGAGDGQRQADFTFFSRDISDLHDSARYIRLSSKDIELLNPNTRTAPIFRSRRDAELTRALYRRVAVLIDRRRDPPRNEWGLRFSTMFHQTNDADLFVEPDWLRKNRYTPEGNRFVKGRKVYLPLYEAKMVQAYDHRAASVVSADHNWMRQNQKEETGEADHADPEYLVLPRWWVDEKEVGERLGDQKWAMGFKDITSPTNQRTMIASFAPHAGYTNHFVLVHTTHGPRECCCLLANLNSFVFDYITRQKIGGVTLNYFIVEQLPTLTPDVYGERCPWTRRGTLRDWISERVLKLSCTAVDMLPLAEAAGFSGGALHDGRINKWRPQQRAELMAELDAAFFVLYGVEREDAAYILSTFQRADDPTPGLPGARSVAERVLDAYDHLRAHAM